MKAQFTTFGAIEIDGRRYDHDVVIDGGKVHQPWGGQPLIVGTGMYGRWPVLPDVPQEAARRKVELIVVPTEEVCRLLADRKSKDVRAVLHVTC
jgi:hypothetical protein